MTYQRYYNQAGAFFSPDPAGLKHVDFGNPLSWNRYSYSLGDPINGIDPTGRWTCLVWESGDTCTSGSIDPCNDNYTIDGFAPSPAPNPACYAPGGDDPGGGGDPDPGLTPMKIKARYDCFTTRVVPGVGAVVERDITYEAYAVVNGADVMLAGDTITEHLTVVSGTKPPESSGRNSFVDGIAIGTNGPFEVKQTFTVSYQGQTYSNLSVYDAYGNAAPNGTNDIKANAKSVSINGNTTAKNGSCN